MLESLYFELVVCFRLPYFWVFIFLSPFILSFFGEISKRLMEASQKIEVSRLDLRINAVDCSRKRDDLTNVFSAANPADNSFQTDSEAAVWH